MIGGALVEKSAGEVGPILDQNIKKIKEAMLTISKQLKDTHGEFETWKKKTNVKIVKAST